MEKKVVMEKIQEMYKKENQEEHFSQPFIWGVIIVCILVDFLTMYQSFEAAFMDNAMLIFTLSFISAGVLDISPYIFAHYLKKDEKNVWDWVAMTFLILLFTGIVFLLYRMRMAAKADIFAGSELDLSDFRTETDVLPQHGFDGKDWALLFMSALPLFTSAISFFVSILPMSKEKRRRLREKHCMEALAMKDELMDQLSLIQNNKIAIYEEEDQLEYQEVLERLLREKNECQIHARELLTKKLFHADATSKYLEQE